ncbi:MAG: universal stress protein [Haloarculaceae archaeon]
MYDTILLPTGGGPGTDEATARALDLARTFDAAVHALYVVDSRSSRDGDVEAVRHALEERGDAATAAVRDRAAQLDLDVVRGDREGVPYRAILDYAGENGVDLVVMATRSRTGTPDHHLGSTTERVLVRSDVPVLTTPLDGETAVPETRYGTYDRVVIPTDGSDTAERAAEHGLAVAERYGADVRVVYVVDTTTYGLEDAPRSIVGLLKEGGQGAVEAIADEARERNLSASTAVLRGAPEDAILQYANGAAADVIAMGTRGRGGFDEHFLGSTAGRVVRRSNVPVLTVS